eukprot:TRINITY_DN380_c0_g1_i3.p1 TRINITY_DN380_c0_g1~~TRINITY_DN380_c0_g1_i3.p1  ORF type:complete len:111 (+),score=3.59 TRINITY_DN380_c0_g1_i3:260-592(+)
MMLLKSTLLFVVTFLLSDVDSSTRFESVNYPGRYIRHQDYKFKLHADDGTDNTFLADSTFNVHLGYATSGFSFEASNFPGYYMKHESYLLDLMIPGSSQREDAAFSGSPV